MTPLEQKIFLTLLDKGVLAIVALLIGYWISKRLEQFRIDRQRISALERDKVVLENELDKLKLTRQIEFKEKQLSQFYWPHSLPLRKRRCNMEDCSPVVGSGDRGA